jgi:hypothetical protein
VRSDSGKSVEHATTVASGSTIRSRLVQDGKPVANAEIGLITHDRRSGTTFLEIIVGIRKDGTLDFTNVPAGRIWTRGKMDSQARAALLQKWWNVRPRKAGS